MNDAQTTATPISVTRPFSPAIDRTAQILFRPFDISKWFVLGFCAWLAFLGNSGGGGSNFNLPGDDSRDSFDTAQGWVQDNIGLVIILAVVLVLVIIGLVVLMTWLSSRGKLMFLDGVMRNRGAVVEPWGRFRAQGNSLFWFRIVVGLIALITFAILVGLMALSLLAAGFDGRGDPGPGVILMLCGWIAAILVAALWLILVVVAIDDFIVPIMWLRECRVREAWSEFLPLLSAHQGTFVRYGLFKILLVLGSILIACVVTCMTCCVAALPYIGAVILLPLHVFHRCYTIGFLSQFGPNYAALTPDRERP